jgi:hypothetical protein
MPEPRHKITWDRSLQCYRCDRDGPLESARPGEDVRAPGSRHAAENGQCPACWGARVYVFERPGPRSYTCRLCRGSGLTTPPPNPT